jgi:hypothetical protein
MNNPFPTKTLLTGGGGLATTYSFNNTNYKRTAIYKLDANGNTQWQKILGYQAPFQGPYIVSTVVVTPMPDGNYLCHGSKDHYTQGTNRSWLVKLSPNGTVLKDTVYDFSSGLDVFSGVGQIIFTESGFYIGGLAYDNINATYSKFYYSNIDNDLNLQWRKPYWKRESENAIFLNKQLDNGFIALAGFVFQDSPTNTADEWFMVLDSMGCETELCAQSIGINELMYPNNNESTVTLYPNPAQDEVYLAIGEYFNSDPITYQIINITGKIVTQGITQQQQAIDIKNLPNGYYVVSLLVEGNRINKPLIVNR